MGVTRVGTVCVVLCSGDEERRVRGTGGVSRSGGDRGVEPIRINLPVQLSRDSFNAIYSETCVRFDAFAYSSWPPSEAQASGTSRGYAST